MAPSDSDTKAPTKQSAFINFLYFLAPKTLLAKEREKRVLSPKAKKKREAVHELIYPFRPKSAPAPALKEPPVAEEVRAAPESVKKKGKKVRFALEEPKATPEDDEMKVPNPK